MRKTPLTSWKQLLWCWRCQPQNEPLVLEVSLSDSHGWISARSAARLRLSPAPAGSTHCPESTNAGSDLISNSSRCPAPIGPLRSRSQERRDADQSEGGWQTRAGAETVAPHCDWPAALSVSLCKGVTSFTWEPTDREPAWEEREQITSMQLPVNEAAAMVGPERLRTARCYLNGYTSVCATMWCSVIHRSWKVPSQWQNVI